MTDEQAVVLEIENTINSMEEADRQLVRGCVTAILALEAGFGTRQLQFAIALIGARLAAA